VAVTIKNAIQRAHFKLGNIARCALTQPMARSAFLYANATAAVKIAAFVKEAIVAGVFGVSGAMDAYLIALMLIGVPLGLLLNSIQTAFIPLYVSVRETSGTQASALFIRTTASATLLAMAAVLILWLIILPWLIDIVGHGFDASKREHIRDLFLWLVPYYFLNGLDLIGHGALQADKRFLPSALLPACTTFMTIAFVLCMRDSDVHALVLGFVIGSLVEWIVLHWLLRRRGASLLPGRISFNPEICRLAKESSVLLGGTFVLSFYPMIELGLASGLGEGTVAAMSYAYKLPTMINGILVAAVGVTVLPFFAEMLVRRDDASCQRAFRRYALVLLAGGILLALGLVMLSKPLVELVFQRGAFHTENTQLVAEIQRGYLIQIPGALVGVLSGRLLLAQGAYGVVSVMGSLLVVVSGVLAWTLSIQIGAVGIALGLSIATTLSAMFLVALALKKFSSTHSMKENTILN